MAHADEASISIADASIVQPASGSALLNFTVTRSGDLDFGIVVPYATANGSAISGTDYTAKSGSVTIPAGASSATIGVPVLAGNNAIDKSFRLKLATPSVAGGSALATFESAGSANTGPLPFAAAVGDFNGDGKQDLVVSGIFGPLTILINSTAPGSSGASFTPAASPAVGGNSFSMAVGDFNGDGKPDLAVANSLDNTVSVLFNNTLPLALSARFATAATVNVGSNPSSVAVGDFNGDGKLDLVVANRNNNNLSVLLNHTVPGAASASFAPDANPDVGSNPDAVAVGDFNGDGQADLAAANFNDKSISVLLNAQHRIALTRGSATGTIKARPDTTPNAFTFIDQLNVPRDSVRTSNAVIITGINAPAPISVSGGTYSIGCTGTFTAVTGTISNGQTVCVRNTSSASYRTAVNTTLTVGGVSDTFTSVTAANAITQLLGVIFQVLDGALNSILGLL